MNPANIRVNGVILAGGKGSRMQFQEKPLLQLGNRRVIDWILQSAIPQVSQLLINVNKAGEYYAEFGLPLISDAFSNDPGPLAGLHAAMLWSLSNDPGCTHVACFPGDVPWFDHDYVRRVLDLMLHEHTQIGWLQTEQQYQPLFSVWDIRMEKLLALALERGHYSPMAFTRSHSNSLLVLAETKPGYYLNLNSPQDMILARTLADQFTLA